MGQRVNESLNAEGVKQAQDLAQSLDKDFDIIFSSPLKRAVETAKLISERLNIPVIEKKELTERDFGSLSGKRWDEMPEAVKSRDDLEQNYDYRSFGGESAGDVKSRFLKFTNELKEKYSDKKILIVAHGGILKMAHSLFSKEIAEIKLHNASMHEFDI